MTIEQAQADRRTLEATVLKTINAYEEKYGVGTFNNLTFRRWNGSNYASGPVVGVSADIRLLDADPAGK